MAKKVRKTVLNELSRTVPLNNVEFEEVNINTLYHATWSVANLYGLEIGDPTTTKKGKQVLQGTRS